MDYKEKYEQALGRAKALYAKGAPDSLHLEEMFPELKESKDEKIVRVIRGWICALSSSFFDDGFSKEEMLAWLKKQGKQKPAECIQWTGKNLKEVIDFTGKSARFDEWFKSWDEYETYVHSHGDIFKLFCVDGSHYEVPAGAWIVKTPDGYNIPSLFRFVQKPAEWSEENKKMLGKILECIRFAEDRYQLEEEEANGVSVKMWLLDHINPQPKQEWSEEDEWKFSDILALLRGGENFHYNTPELFDWLKSLKQRMKGE